MEANASAGVAQIEVWAGQRRVALITNSAPLPTAVSTTVSADLSSGPFGEVRLAAIVRDGLGRVGGDADTLVMVEGELAPEGPSTGLVLSEPVALSVLAPLIAESGAQVVEFFHERAFAGPIALDPGLAGLLAEDGESADQEPDAISGGFYGRGLSLEEQIDTYGAAYGAKLPGEEPQVFGLRIEGHVATADLGPLAPRVAARVELGPRQAFSAAGLAAGGPEAAIADRPEAPKLLAAAAATPRPPWWPTYGSFWTNEFTRTFPRTCIVVGPPFFGIGIPCPFLTVSERRAEFFHTMAWKPTALSGFESSQWAYEHDFKVQGASRSGTKPFCTPIGRNDFYVTRRGVTWESSFGRAAPYFDTDKLDDCGTEDLTVGLALPEKLNDNRPNSNVTGWITIDARRGNPATGPFQLAAQSLLRETGFPCDQATIINYVRKWCIGENGDETLNAVVVDSQTGPNGGVPLPRCFVWRWLPIGSHSDPPTTFRGRSCEGEF